MGRMVLVTGGARSGKSAYALAVAEARPGPRLYLATCPVVDDEMRQRIDRHRRERAGRGWRTLEEPTDLAGAVAGVTHAGVILVDCLTLWVNNLMFAAAAETALDEDAVAAACGVVVGACRAGSAAVVLVTNEVGLGIVPANPPTRRYRDLVGRCNQVFAAAADEVVLVSCGLPLRLKPAAG